LISTTSLSTEIVAELSCGDARLFANWPDPAVPTFGAGVYTIWHKDGRFIYVGMSGRGITAGTIQRNTPQGIYTRLHTRQWTPQRRPVLCLCRRPARLADASQEDITAIGSGRDFERRFPEAERRAREAKLWAR
jgi:hypothetical protein